MFGDPTPAPRRGVDDVRAAGGPGLMLGHRGGASDCQAIVAHAPADAAYLAVMFNDEVPAEAGL
jgi:hypothetical protein